jgi:hypothetical protein
MCPACITTAALFAATSASGVGVLGFMAAKFQWWQRAWRGFGSTRRHRLDTGATTTATTEQTTGER